MTKQPESLHRPLGGSLLQPVATLALPTQRARLATVAAELQLRLNISSTCCLAQQFKTKTAITRRTAVATEQPTEAALRHNHTLARRLLEQMPSKALGAVSLPDMRTVQQPRCQPYRQTHPDTGRRRRLDTSSHDKQQAHIEKARTVLLFPIE